MASLKCTLFWISTLFSSAQNIRLIRPKRMRKKQNMTTTISSRKIIQLPTCKKYVYQIGIMKFALCIPP